MSNRHRRSYFVLDHIDQEEEVEARFRAGVVDANVFHVILAFSDLNA